MGNTIVLIVSAYCLCGGINGSGVTATGKPLAQGMAACGRAYKFGTVFEIVGPRTAGMPRLVTCEDRGGAITNAHLDVAIVSADHRADRVRAFGWGRRRVQVRVWASMEAYRAANPVRYSCVERKVCQ